MNDYDERGYDERLPQGVLSTALPRWTRLHQKLSNWPTGSGSFV